MNPTKSPCTNADLYVDTLNFPLQKSLGQQYLQKYRELRRQRQPLVFPRSAHGQILPDGVVIYDRDPDGSFGHGYTEEAVRFDPSPPQESAAVNFEYFGASDSAARGFGVGRYTRQMTAADRANAAAAAAATAAAENKGSFRPLCIVTIGEAGRLTCGSWGRGEQIPRKWLFRFPEVPRF